MPSAALPASEAERLEALHSYGVLDSACDEAFDDIARLAAKLTGCPIALVSLIDRDRQWFRARHGLDTPQTPRESAFCAHAILEPQVPLVVPDATLDARFADNDLVTGGPGFRFYVGLPLVNPEGHALGTLCVLDRAPRAISASDLGTLASLARTVVTTLELRRACRRAANLALTDALTGLPNRPAFLLALAQAVARQRRDLQPFSLLYMDLDGLKRVNDVQGHAAGDEVLREAAGALLRCVRIEDTASRIGGDEFGAVLVGGDGSEAAQVAERVRVAVKACMDARGFPVTVSIGAVCFLDPPEDEEEAVAAADELMYAAKAKGRNRVLAREHRCPPRREAA